MGKQKVKEATKKKEPFKFKKPTKRQVKSFLLYCLIVLAGNAIASAGASFFIEPSGFVMGGTTGLGIFVRNMIEWYVKPTPGWTDWVVNIVIYTVNIALFIVGACLLGKKFAASVAAGTVLYPAFMSLYKLVPAKYYAIENPIISMIAGSLLFGLGIAMVVRVGASTGGTDIPPLILKKFFDWPISVTMWIVDFAIVAINLIAPNIHLEDMLYGVFITLISSLVIDKVSPIGMKRMQVKIISNEYKAIRELIINEISRGVTVLYGQTGYLKEDCHMLLTVVSNRELVRLREAVQKIDPKAFMTISVVSEVRGRGFSVDKFDADSPKLREISEEELNADKNAPPKQEPLVETPPVENTPVEPVIEQAVETAEKE